MIICFFWGPFLAFFYSLSPFFFGPNAILFLLTLYFALGYSRFALIGAASGIPKKAYSALSPHVSSRRYAQALNGVLVLGVGIFSVYLVYLVHLVYLTSPRIRKARTTREV